MASITKRGQRWLVQVRRKGVPALSRTFGSVVDARAWAAMEEARMERAEHVVPRRLLASVTLGTLIDRYLLEVTAAKRSAFSERIRLLQLKRDRLVDNSLADLNSTHVADYRDRRLTEVKGATVRRELAIISHVLEVARKEWGYRLPANPVREIRQPPVGAARNRRLEGTEQAELMGAIDGSRSKYLAPIVELALETGMRRGEILGLTWNAIDLKQRLAHIPRTKTGNPRTIPLTDRAVSVLAALEDTRNGSLFKVTPNAFRLAWVRAVARSGLNDFRFHDLRHEAISRFFELGLSLPEVATISGHRDPRMLFRYTHLRPTELARKLAGHSWTPKGRLEPHVAAPIGDPNTKLQPTSIPPHQPGTLAR